MKETVLILSLVYYIYLTFQIVRVLKISRREMSDFYEDSDDDDNLFFKFVVWLGLTKLYIFIIISQAI